MRLVFVIFLLGCLSVYCLQTHKQGRLGDVIEFGEIPTNEATPAPPEATPTPSEVPTSPPVLNNEAAPIPADSPTPTQEVTPTEAANEQVTPTEAVNGEVTPTQAVNGEVTPTEAANGEVTPTEAAVTPTEAAVTPTEAANGEIAPTEAANGEGTPTQAPEPGVEGETPVPTDGFVDTESPQLDQKPIQQALQTKKPTRRPTRIPYINMHRGIVHIFLGEDTEKCVSRRNRLNDSLPDGLHIDTCDNLHLYPDGSLTDSYFLMISDKAADIPGPEIHANFAPNQTGAEIYRPSVSDNDQRLLSLGTYRNKPLFIFGSAHPTPIWMYKKALKTDGAQDIQHPYEVFCWAVTQDESSNIFLLKTNLSFKDCPLFRVVEIDPFNN